MGNTTCNRRGPVRIVLSAMLLAGLLSGCKDAARINAGGASFIYPAMLVWTREYEKRFNIQIDYQSTGSGNGVQQTVAGTIDFGCTDAFIKDDKLAAAADIGGEILHIPLAMGAVVPIYNLPGVDKPLNFTGPILADIYMGAIERWNDPALQAINPDVKLPEQPIVPVFRSDGSGTTAIFTDYLSKVSDTWKKEIKSGTTVSWPRGVGQRGNEGVSGHVHRSPYSFGYVELIFAIQNQVAFGRVEGKDSMERNRKFREANGKELPFAERVFTAASLAGVSAAADAMLDKIPKDLRYSLTNAPGKASYPIAGTNWAVFYAKRPPKIAKELKEFLLWVTEFGGDGQKRAAELGYAPLPENLTLLIREKLQNLVSE